VRVKARALVWIDGRLILAEQRRRGQPELSLPGGRVNAGESVTEALRREVLEETGLVIEPVRLLYVSERVGPAATQDLELIFLARSVGVPRLGGLRAVDLNGGERPDVRPPILDLIASDAATEWRGTPRWLGNLAAQARDAERRPSGQPVSSS